MSKLVLNLKKSIRLCSPRVKPSTKLQIQNTQNVQSLFDHQDSLEPPPIWQERQPKCFRDPSVDTSSLPDRFSPLPITPEEVSLLLQAERATLIKTIDLRQSCTFADYFIIGTCSSSKGLKITASGVHRQVNDFNCVDLFKFKHRPCVFELLKRELLIEGAIDEDDWLVVDLGRIIVHLFLDHARIKYNIESIWEEKSEIKVEMK